MESPEATRELVDVTILVCETSPNSFEVNFTPTSPSHIARQGFTIDTRRGAKGKSLAQVLDWAEDDGQRLEQVAAARGYKRGWVWHQLRGDWQ